MGKQKYLTDFELERIYALVRNSLESSDLSEEDCEKYYKLLNKLKS